MLDFGDLMKTIYLCEFSCPFGVLQVISEEGIGAFIDGFWINDALDFTKGSDCKYWIPPSGIELIEKREIEI